MNQNKNIYSHIMSQIINLKSFINMESNDELKQINQIFVLMTWLKLKTLILIIFNRWKAYENISVYNISYKTLIDAKPLHIRFVKIRVYDGTRHLVLFGSDDGDDDDDDDELS